MIKIDVVNNLKAIRNAKEILFWNGESFWSSKERLLVQGSPELLAKVYLSQIAAGTFEYFDVGDTLSKINRNSF